MHRFLHLGDLHLGPNDRNDDRIAALDQAIREGLQQPLAAWLVPGDLNHGRMTIPDKNVLTGRAQLMANHAPVVICYGNHDLPGDLDFLAKLSAKYPIYVVSRSEVIYFQTATGANAAIFVLPYPTRAGLVALGVSSDNLVDVARGALDLIFMDAAAKLADARKDDAITLMIGHVNVAGSIVSSGQPNIGREIEIDQALLDRLGPIYKGLNHIHKAQEICGARYPGSVCRLDWGEVDPKGYLTIDVEPTWEGDGYTFVVETHQLDVAPMYLIEARLDRDRFNPEHDDLLCGDCGGDCDGERDASGDTMPCATCFATPGLRSFAGAEVRVRVRFVAADLALLNWDLVATPFAGAKRLTIERIAEHTRAIRAPEVTAAETLDEKLLAIAKGAGVDWTPSLTEKLALLQQAPDGAAFLNAIEDSLSIIDAEVPEEVLQ